jgi:lysozyme family protein
MVVQTRAPTQAPTPYLATTRGSEFDIAWRMTYRWSGLRPPHDLGRTTFLAKRDYWFPMRLDLLNSQLVANNLFDFAYQHGVRGTVKKLQLCLARYFDFKGKIDGILGSETIGHINEVISVSQGAAFAIHQVMVKTRIDYYLSTAKPEYLKGFVARANDFL